MKSPFPWYKMHFLCFNKLFNNIYFGYILTFLLISSVIFHLSLMADVVKLSRIQCHVIWMTYVSSLKCHISTVTPQWKKKKKQSKSLLTIFPWSWFKTLTVFTKFLSKASAIYLSCKISTLDKMQPIKLTMTWFCVFCGTWWFPFCCCATSLVLHGSCKQPFFRFNNIVVILPYAITTKPTQTVW